MPDRIRRGLLNPSVDALCEGTLEHNGFYGDGVVNALTASIG